ncbi:MAG: hypothetical protein K1000chlam4_00551 [Chlamydiae bacterium]|nr:hypothetical protein [Chlamydiota bacterium]
MLEDLEPLTPVHFFALGAECHHYSGRKELPLPKKHLLSDLSDLTGDQTFAEVSLGWSKKGITATIRVSRSTIEPFFPDFTAGDSVEFFIDTRDVKTSGSNTRFCHHFYFLPLPVQTNGESIQAGEVTRFRTDDSHELCDSSLLYVACERERKKNVSVQRVSRLKGSSCCDSSGSLRRVNSQSAIDEEQNYGDGAAGRDKGTGKPSERLQKYTLQLFIPAVALHGYDPSQFDRLGFTYRINRYDDTPQHFSASSEDFSIEQYPSTWASLKLIKE